MDVYAVRAAEAAWTVVVDPDLGYGGCRLVVAVPESWIDVSHVIDATATNPIEHRDAPPGRPLEEILADPRTLQVDDIIARTEYALAGRFATITTVAELNGE